MGVSDGKEKNAVKTCQFGDTHPDILTGLTANER